MCTEIWLHRARHLMKDSLEWQATAVESQVEDRLRISSFVNFVAAGNEGKVLMMD